MIELKNIDVTFQNGSHEFKAVDNVSLKINKGEIFGIVSDFQLRVDALGEHVVGDI